MTTVEIVIPLIALALGGCGILAARFSAYRLHRDDPKRPPAE